MADETPKNLPKIFEGRTEEEARAKAAAALGPDYTVITIGEERSGGIGGFFERRTVKLMAQKTAELGRYLDETDDASIDISAHAKRLAQELLAAEEAAGGRASEQDPAAPSEPREQPELKEFASGLRTLLDLEEAPGSAPDPAQEPPPGLRMLQELDDTPETTAEPPPFVVVDTDPAPAAPTPSVATEAPPSDSPLSRWIVIDKDTPTLRNELVEAGLDREIVQSLVAEAELLATTQLEVRDQARQLLARKIAAAAPLPSLASVRNLAVIGEAGAGRSTLVSRLVTRFAGSGVNVGAASVGEVGDPGISLVQSASVAAGVFHAWGPTTKENSIRALSAAAELLVIDLAEADPRRHAEQLAALRRTVTGGLDLIVALPVGNVRGQVKTLDEYPRLLGIVVTFSDRAKPSDLANLALLQKNPVLFLAGEGGLEIFDPEKISRGILPA